jgi:hypothetical protein
MTQAYLEQREQKILRDSKVWMALSQLYVTHVYDSGDFLGKKSRVRLRSIIPLQLYVTHV